MDTQDRAEIDPILSPREMWTEAGISRATWLRTWRHKLPMLWVSPRRIGCRRSAWHAALAEQTEKAA